MLFRMTSVSLALALAGCGLFDDLSTGSGYCIAQIKQTCRAQFQCCTAAERLSQFGGLQLLLLDPYTTEGECVEEFSKLCESFGASVDESIAEGRMEMDQGKAQSCVDKLKEAVDKCEPEGFLNRDPDCDEALSGTVAAGKTCFQDGECKDEGATCQVEPNDDPEVIVVSIEGKCRAPLGEGDACSFDGDEDCGPGLECRDTDGDFDEDTCIVPKGDGEPCTVDDECDSFFCNNDECVGGGEGEGEEEEIETEYEICDGLE